MEDEPKREPSPRLRWEQFHQVMLHLDGVGVCGKSKSSREPTDMRVDWEAGKVEHYGAHDVAGLASHAWQGRKVVEFGRDRTIEAFF